MTGNSEQRARHPEAAETQSLLDRVRGAVRDVEEHLDLLPASPLLREMRARLHAYEAVVNLWAYRPPTELQVRTMLELVTELADRVRLRRPSATRPPPPPGAAEEWSLREEASAVHERIDDGRRTDYLMTARTAQTAAHTQSARKIHGTNTAR